mgnify:CR=1 FL=1
MRNTTDLITKNEQSNENRLSYEELNKEQSENEQSSNEQSDNEKSKDEESNNGILKKIYNYLFPDN